MSMLFVLYLNSLLLLSPFTKRETQALAMNTVTKNFCRFYHPHQNHEPLDEGIYDKDKDLEFQIQLGSKLYPEFPCNSILLRSVFIIYEKH